MMLRPGLLLPPAILVLLLASGCSTVIGGACHKPQPHHTAGNLPPLKVPVGLDGPDTPPATTAPPLPATPEYDLTAIERLSRSPEEAEEDAQETERRRPRRPPSRPR